MKKYNNLEDYFSIEKKCKAKIGRWKTDLLNKIKSKITTIEKLDNIVTDMNRKKMKNNWEEFQFEIEKKKRESKARNITQKLMKY